MGKPVHPWLVFSDSNRKFCRILPLAELLDLWALVQSALRQPGKLHQITAFAADPEHHWIHPVPTLVLGLRGVARITQGRGPAIDLHPGDAVVVAPGATHDHVPLRNQSAALALGFDSGMCDVVLSTATVSVDAVMPQHPAWAMVQRLLANDARALPELLGLVLDRPLQATQPLPPAVSRMRDYIRSHGLSPITASDLARVSGLGTSRAWQVFRHHFGCTPRQALEQRRCAVAAAMLRQGLRINDIVTRCGFHDRGTFTRAFTRHHGLPPAEWRDGNSPHQ